MAVERYLAGVALLGALALPYQFLALAIGAGTGWRGPAVGATATVAIGGNLVYSLLSLVDSLVCFARPAPGTWYLPCNMLVHGVSTGGVIVPLTPLAARPHV